MLLKLYILMVLSVFFGCSSGNDVTLEQSGTKKLATEETQEDTLVAPENPAKAGISPESQYEESEYALEPVTVGGSYLSVNCKSRSRAVNDTVTIGCAVFKHRSAESKIVRVLSSEEVSVKQANISHGGSNSVSIPVKNSDAEDETFTFETRIIDSEGWRIAADIEFDGTRASLNTQVDDYPTEFTASQGRVFALGTVGSTGDERCSGNSPRSDRSEEFVFTLTVFLESTLSIQLDNLCGVDADNYFEYRRAGDRESTGIPITQSGLMYSQKVFAPGEYQLTIKASDYQQDDDRRLDAFSFDSLSISHSNPELDPGRFFLRLNKN